MHHSKFLFRILFVTASLFFVSSAFAATTQEPPIVSSLSNGITTVIVPKHGAPVVSVQVWVHVGSKDEDDSTRGLAHIQEHMLFQGTKQYAPGTIFKTVQSVGGDMNAYTSYDETVYHITLPKENVRAALSILSSMMHESIIDPETLEKELEVVMEEFRRNRQNPRRMLDQAIAAAAFREHPYRHPVIGYQDTIQNITVDQVRNFYTQWYVPENMTLVVVGDVDPIELNTQISETFEKIPRRKNPKRDIAPEPMQKTFQSVIAQGAFKNTSLEIAIKAPRYVESDAPAMDVLMSVLGLGKSSRLLQSIKEKKGLVSSIDAAFYTPEHSYLSIIQADIEAKDSARALTAILQELQSMKYERVSEQELKRAKVQLEAAVHFKEQSYDGAARNLGYQKIVGGSFDSEAKYLQKVASVTSEDLQNVARKYFVPTQMTIGLLYPKDEKNMITKQRLTTMATRILGHSKPEPKSAEPNVFRRTFDPASGVSRVEMSNGVTLLIREDHGTKTFSTHVLMLGGVRLETPTTNGLSAFVSRMLLRGTKNMNQTDIAQKLDTMSASISPFSDRNTLGLSLNSLSAYSTETMKILFSLLSESTFPEEQIERVRTELLSGIARKKDNPFLLSFQQLNRGIYGTHPYGLPQDGSADVLKRLTQKDLRTFAQKTITPENMVIAIVGDVSTDDMIERVASSFGTLKRSGFSESNLSVPTFSKNNVLKTHGPYEQAHIFLGFPTFSLDHSDRYALAVADSILGSEGGRLFSILRDKESLAYSVEGFTINGYKTPGFYGMYLGCDPAKTETAIESLQRELKRIVSDGVSDSEVQEAVQNIAGKYVVGLQTPDSQARLLAVSERYSLGFDDYVHFVKRLRAVTKEDVQRIAKTYFDLEKSTLSIVRSEVK